MKLSDIKIDFGRYKSRKFLAAVAIIVLASVFLCLGKINQETWLTVLKWVAPFYFGLNVAQKLGLNLKGGNQDET